MKQLSLTLLLLFFAAANLYAAEENTASEEPEQSVEQLPVEEVVEPPFEGEDADEPSDENFVPSVQIAEDLPVAFPIDI